MDMHFNAFIEEFGEPDESYAVQDSTMAYFEGKLPDQLLKYWDNVGFCRFQHGCFWLVNPMDYEAALESWLKDTYLPEIDDYHVIARSGFGSLFLWGHKTGFRWIVRSFCGWISQLDGNEKLIRAGNETLAMQIFFSCLSRTVTDVNDEDGKPLFRRATRKLGSLGYDEVFAFEPSLILGGRCRLENLSKANIFVHLDILSQLGQIEVLSRDDLRKKAFGQ